MWKPGPGGKGKGVRKLVALYLVFYLVLLLVPPGVLLLGQDSGEAALAQGEALSPAPAESSSFVMETAAAPAPLMTIRLSKSI